MTPSQENTYGPYAAIYDRLWGPRLPDMVMPALDELLLGHVPPDAALLDLCCGTGRITEALSRRGYAMTGLDICPAMLDLARLNAPSCRLIHEDACRFDLPSSFHGVLSTSDSVNHVVRLEDLDAMFTNVHRALRPGGRFVFDVLLAEHYEPEEERTDATVEDDWAMFTHETWDAAERTSRCTMTLFYREAGVDGWKRWDSASAERFYSAAELESALGRAGFTGFRLYDRARDLGMDGWNRTYVVVTQGEEPG